MFFFTEIRIVHFSLSLFYFYYNLLFDGDILEIDKNLRFSSIVDRNTIVEQIFSMIYFLLQVYNIFILVFCYKFTTFLSLSFEFPICMLPRHVYCSLDVYWREEGQPHHFHFRATFSSFSHPNHIGNLFHAFLIKKDIYFKWSNLWNFGHFKQIQ